MESLDKWLGWLDQIQGLPAIALVFISCIVAGYLWRFLPFKWANNDSTPAIVILWGAFAFSAIADPRASNMPLRVWFIRNLLIGLSVGFIAWMTHNAVLKKIEDWLVAKFPGFGDTAFFRQPPKDSAPPPTCS